MSLHGYFYARMQRKAGRAQRGVTLPELIVAIAVAAVVTTLAVPTFRTAILNSRISSTTMELIATFNTARALSGSDRNPVTVTVTANGWQLTQAGQEDQMFTVPTGVTLLDMGGNPLTVGDDIQLFDRRGIPDQALVTAVFTFQVCDGRPDETGRQVTVNPAGRVTSDPVVCP